MIFLNVSQIALCFLNHCACFPSFSSLCGQGQNAQDTNPWSQEVLDCSCIIWDQSLMSVIQCSLKLSKKIFSLEKQSFYNQICYLYVFSGCFYDACLSLGLAWFKSKTPNIGHKNSVRWFQPEPGTPVLWPESALWFSCDTLTCYELKMKSCLELV